MKKFAHAAALLALFLVLSLSQVLAQDNGPLAIRIGYQRGSLYNVPQILEGLKTALHETVGMKSAADACIGVLKGENFGKSILKIKL